MTMAVDIRLKRVYEEAEAADGTRVLVDRLWPRGLKKENLLGLIRSGPVTLLYAAKDEAQSNAAALRRHLFTLLAEDG